MELLYIYLPVIIVSLLLNEAQSYYDTITRHNFDNIVDGGKLALLLFYSDNCPECQRINPIFQKAVERYKDYEDVVLSAIDINKDRVLSMRFNVENVPTVRYFPYSKRAKHMDVITFQAIDDIVTATRLEGKLTRDLHANEDKLSYLYSVDKSIAAAKEISSDDFAQLVINSKQHVMVSLYTDGCGVECTEFDKVADIFKNDEHMALLKINVMDAPDLAQRFSVTRNPTLLWYPKDDKKYGKIYGSAITVHELVAFLNDKAGTSRQPSGQLTLTAGRISELDMILEANIMDVVTGRNLKYLIEQIGHRAESVHHEKRYVDYYLKLLEEINKGKSADVVLEKENDYITQRLSKKNLSTKEREEWTKFRNIIHGIVDMAAKKMQLDRSQEKAEKAKLSPPIVIDDKKAKDAKKQSLRDEL